MSLLARFDPGDTFTGLILICVIQTSLIIFLAALCGQTILRWRAHARHGLWLGTLILVLISPALAGVADRSGLGLWVIPVAIPGPAKCDC